MMIMMSSFISIYMFLSMIYTCIRAYQRKKIKKLSGEYLSTDEEDDKDFLSRFHRFRVENNENEDEPANPLERLQRNRNLNLIDHIQHMFAQNERRRQIITQLDDFERHLVEATNKLQKLLLKRYLKSLTNLKFEEYQSKDPDMPDCSICLVNFAPTDDIVVYECDPKHYFHEQCGLEWLQTKTECPLCRADFAQSIMRHKKKHNQDDLRDVAMETAIQAR